MIHETAPTSFRRLIADLFNARVPILSIETWEERRLLGELQAVVDDPALVTTPRSLFSWSRTSGFRRAGDQGSFAVHSALDAIEEALDVDEPAVIVLHDFHPYIDDDASVRRALRELAEHLRHCSPPKNVVLTAPSLTIPLELEKDLYSVDFRLPSVVELKALLQHMRDINGVPDLGDSEHERIARAAAGLTFDEAENAFARMFIEAARNDEYLTTVVLDEKQRAIGRSDVLELLRPTKTLDEMGGLENLKDWLTKRSAIWSGAGEAYGLPSPKGVLLTGIPGCGKSLSAHCISGLWNLPLLRLDVGRVFNKWIGNSEANMRAALRTAEELAPAVLWIDEIEKGFGQAEFDAGTAGRIFATLLTWMQENTAPVFVVATANRVERLPAELLRKGRFDEVFFVDLPTEGERWNIWRLHLERQLDAAAAAGGLLVGDDLLGHLTSLTAGFTGAEIEQAVVAALFDAFAERRPLQASDLQTAVANTIPLSVSQRERVAEIRRWARTRAFPASKPELSLLEADAIAPTGDPRGQGGRRIDF